MSTNPELENELAANMEDLKEAGVGDEAERLAEILEDPDAALPAGGTPAAQVSEATRQRTDEVIAKAEEARAAFAEAGNMKEIGPET